MRLRNFLVFIVALMVAALVVIGSGCTGGKAQPDPAVVAPQGNDSVKEFNVTAKQYEFIPGEIIVNKGDRVILHLKSIDVTHGFSILDYYIN